MPEEPLDGRAGAQCVQEGPCKCRSDQGIIDLSPIQGTASHAAFPDQADSQGQYLYSYSPCTPFSEGSQECVSVGVCQVSMDKTSSYPAGTVESATFGMDSSGNTQVTYSQTDSHGTTRTTIVTLQCAQSGGTDILNVQGEDPNYPSTYDMTLVSRHCCVGSGPGPGPSPSGGSGGALSVGSILCIALLGVVCVYVAAGVAVQRGMRQATGREVFPNYSFWAALPAYIKDGCVFTFTGCKGQRTYDKI
ncbi:hypothetical protein ACOMHN_066996 [Nucella lapillus]